MKPLAVVAAACVACGSGDAATVVEVPPQPLPEPPPASTVAPPQPSLASGAPLRAGDVWRGTYVCAQGQTDLELRVLPSRGSTVRAVFAFSHAPSGAEGAYTLQGSVSSNGVVLVPDRWLQRPPGYVMVGMHGDVHGPRFSGRIDGPGCTTFELAR